MLPNPQAQHPVRASTPYRPFPRLNPVALPLGLSLVLSLVLVIWHQDASRLNVVSLCETVAAGLCLGIAVGGMTGRILPARRGQLVLGIAALASLSAAAGFAIAVAALVPRPPTLILVIVCSVLGIAGLVNLVQWCARGFVRLRHAGAHSIEADDRSRWVMTTQPVGCTFEFAAVVMPMRTLVLAITNIIVVTGFLAFFELMLGATTMFGEHTASWVFGLACVVLAPMYWITVRILRRRTTLCRVSFTSSAIIITLSGEAKTVQFAGVTRLEWRERGEFARCVVETPQLRLSLVAGLARALQGSSNLPPLPVELAGPLRSSGLQRSASSGPTAHVFRRSSG